MRKRILVIGRGDMYPSYTPDVIYAMDVDLWEQLALAVDAEIAHREQKQREAESQSRSRRSRR
ncbi:MAG: hypothetical protein IJO71_11430 [Microbacterium sp.]|uniref:hypothetical protein n=1 Tax=Microbacterium sp. TaxID=51671 RepID=UPI0025DD96FE|nr:hypothetical protein [Microbacterium sp.]MBQ9917795.1 hypothetical protein [Microbacterium sp.]